MLHIVNKSPTDTPNLQSCLRMAQPGHAVLLIEDGVYAATSAQADACGLAGALTSLRVYALQPDLDARGMGSRLLPGVTPIDYGGFVDLVTEHTNNQSWI